MKLIIYYLCRLPGHDRGGLWPPWISSHYSVRTSQHLLDPYTLAHVRYSHGLDISTLELETDLCEVRSFTISEY